MTSEYPDVATDLASVSALDTKGRKVVLGELWRERPHVLIFVRHFG